MSEFSSELAFPSLSISGGRVDSLDRKKSVGSVGKHKLMSKPTDEYEQPKFDKFKSSYAGLNRDLHTVQKKSVRRSLPPKAKMEKKYGISVNKKKEEF